MATQADNTDLRNDGVATAYDRWAPIYDLVFGRVFKEGRNDAINAAEAALPDGGRVLEVGVGTGLNLPLYKKSTRLVAIDLSPAMIEKVRSRKAKHGWHNVEHVEVMNAQAMTFDDNAFEVLVGNYVVTSCPDPEAALDEFVRVTKPGGEIIITTRIGANKGLRGRIEKTLMPITRRLGFRTEFPYERYANWARANGQVELLENRPLPPLGHFSILRYRKSAN
ncbi:class I SAM-dependent methyltransferase [Aurantiacibacter poecillastricola]|uniref:class I SAM-dependent methyltransferase n=1 Tax=Aurantiacibacter poecillastricola TaxID=3064385 RepID=UPI00273F0E6A|nr:class I SAM-dependent methyltransferase [Aurantiacibacter sp. 219JJ12-13]MDP5262818.1 class I SAM-dependent methyltransferase [Aurantiacibacter sp. 219JJ12-13]